MAQLDNWTFNGRLAVRQPDDSWNASLRWEQDGDRYDIRLSGAFGQGAARLFGSDGYAVIETADQAALSASSPEALMAEQLGWSVPVEDLKHWLVGVPGPGYVAAQELDEYGRLTWMEQGGWEIRYRDYMFVEGVELPRKLELENARLRARLVIDAWRLEGARDA